MKVITLMGADACGKDTQAALLKKHFEASGKSVQVITIWDSLAHFSMMPDKKSLQEIVEVFLLKYEAHARSFFLMSCLRNAAMRMDHSKDIILLNGFFHKYWASELSYGAEPGLWEDNMKQFPSSDKIFYLKTSVEECLKRKVHWSNYEQGLGLHRPSDVRVSKEIFQKHLHEHLDTIASLIPELVTIDGSQSEDQVFKNILKAL